MTWPWRGAPPPSVPLARPAQHSFPPYATVCERCGLQLIYAAQPDTPLCISDEELKARRAVLRIMRR